MKLIVGLGNPGMDYADNRHNIGFKVLKSLASSLKISFKKDNTVSALVARAKIDAEDIILALPQTFMNLSGISVKALLKKFGADTKDLLVVCDDLDLELGRIKIRPSGSSAGHNGLKSIIQEIGTKDFNRLKIGIGRPRGEKQVTDYVLSPFTKQEKGQIGQAINISVECLKCWLEKGITQTMNIYNAALPRAGREEE